MQGVDTTYLIGMTWNRSHRRHPPGCVGLPLPPLLQRVKENASFETVVPPPVVSIAHRDI